MTEAEIEAYYLGYTDALSRVPARCGDNVPMYMEGWCSVEQSDRAHPLPLPLRYLHNIFLRGDE